MSEAKKHSYEVRGAWIGLLGAIGSTIFALVFILSGDSLLIRYPGTGDELSLYMNVTMLSLQIVHSNLQGATIISYIVLIPSIIALLISVYRTKLGVSFSGILLFVMMIIAFVGCTLFFSFLTIAEVGVNEVVNRTLLVLISGGAPSELWLPDIDMIYGTTILITWTDFYLWGPYLLLIILIGVGGIYMLSARPMPVAKYRRNRMKFLAKADNFERTGKPLQAIKFYDKAADLSMKLREEDKATEYYSKARQIHETAVEAVLKMEEEKKRKELALRRAKLEEERKDILMKADEAEEVEDWERAYHLYREAADRSVDLGQKKLAAQFTAKAKELLRKDKEKKKVQARKKEEEEKRKEDFEKKKEEMRKQAEKI